MNVAVIKRKIQYASDYRDIRDPYPPNLPPEYASLDFACGGKNKKQSRKALFQEILDTADELRREYGENLENMK